MKYGFCLPGGSFMPQGVAEVKSASDILFDGYKVVADAGFDYGECTVGLLRKLTPDELYRVGQMAADGEIILRACNSLMPGDMKLAGNDVDFPALTAFVDSVMAKMSAVGSHILVLGSGRARSIPDGFDQSAGRAQIMEFLCMCGDTGKKYGVTMALEPLNRRESNIMTTSAECLEMVRELAHPFVKLLIDSFHFSEENEPLENIAAAADMLIHIHIAEPVCRKRPSYRDGDFHDGGRYIRAFIGALEKCGYDGGVTVECGLTEFVSDVELSFDFLHNK